MIGSKCLRFIKETGEIICIHSLRVISHNENTKIIHCCDSNYREIITASPEEVNRLIIFRNSLLRTNHPQIERNQTTKNTESNKYNEQIWHNILEKVLTACDKLGLTSQLDKNKIEERIAICRQCSPSGNCPISGCCNRLEKWKNRIIFGQCQKFPQAHSSNKQ